MFGDDDLIATHDVGQRLRSFRVRTGDAGNDSERNRSLTSGGGNAPLRAGELTELLADGLHQLVEMHKVERGIVHRLLHLGQGTRSTHYGECAAAIYQWTNPNPGKEVVVLGALAHKRGAARVRAGRICRW